MHSYTGVRSVCELHDFQIKVTAFFEYFQIRVKNPNICATLANLYSSSNVFVQVCLNVCIGNNGTVTTNRIFKNNNKKKVFCLSACIVLNVILWKLSVLFVVVLHIEQFDYTFARFVWITCQYDISFFFYFVVEQKPSGWNPRSMWVKGGGRGKTRSVATKKKELQHCIVTYSQELNIMHYTKYIVLIREQVQTTSTTFKIKCKKMVPRDKWYMKWVYLNNLRNICFICYFIYLNLNEILFLIPNTFLPRVQRSYVKKKSDV